MSGFRGARAAGSLGLVVFAGLAVLTAPVRAYAQSSDTVLQDEYTPPHFTDYEVRTVFDAPHPQWSALGVRVSSFIVRPEVKLGHAVTSNAFQVASPKDAASVITINPDILATSDWSRHLLQLHGNLAMDRYVGKSSRNETRWNASAVGRLDITNQLSATLRVADVQFALNRFNAESTSTIAAVALANRFVAKSTIQYARGRLQLTGDAEYLEIHFKPLKLIDGSRQEQSAKDRRAYRFIGQINYAFTPSFGAYAQVDGGWADFLRPSVPLQGANADSSGYRALAGAKVSIPGLGTARAAAGYARRSYSDATLAPVDGLIAEGEIQLVPTALASLRFNAYRHIVDATLVDSLPAKQDSISITAAYVPLRNITFQASAGLDRQNFFFSQRKASTTRFNLEAEYLANRRLSFGAVASYAKRRPDLSNRARDFDELRVGLSATVKL